MKEALQLEVIARQAAEAKVQRLQKTASAMDGQLRLAHETVGRLQRDQQRARKEAQGGGDEPSSSMSNVLGAAARLAEGL